MNNAVRRAWTYFVAAAVVIFLVSACSRGGTDTPPDTASPTVPTNVQAVSLSPNVIVLTWSPSNDDAGVTQYEVYVGGVPIVSLPSTTTMFLYSDLTPSVEYCCTVRAIDAAGNESALSDPPACAVTGSVTDTAPPAVPTDLRGTASQSKIALSWNATADAVRFGVYQDSVLVGTVTSPSYTALSLAASTPYCYAVTAFDDAGNESAKSAPLCITTLAPPLDTSIPTVITTSPSSNATDVQIDGLVVTATFSEPMNLFSVEMADRFTITSAAGPVIGLVKYNGGNTVSFTSSNPLAPGEVYTASINKNVQDIAGNFMGTDYIWSFTTTTTPLVTLPTVSSTAPSNGVLNVPINIVIKAVFSETMDQNTILVPSNFACFDTTRIPPSSVSGLVTYDVNNKTASFMPSADLINHTNLNPGTIYECRISKNVTDLSGHGMAANFAWHFVTAP